MRHFNRFPEGKKYMKKCWLESKVEKLSAWNTCKGDKLSAAQRRSQTEMTGTLGWPRTRE